VSSERQKRRQNSRPIVKLRWY